MSARDLRRSETVNWIFTYQGTNPLCCHEKLNFQGGRGGGGIFFFLQNGAIVTLYRAATCPFRITAWSETKTFALIRTDERFWQNSASEECKQTFVQPSLSSYSSWLVSRLVWIRTMTFVCFSNSRSYLLQHAPKRPRSSSSNEAMR